MELPSFCKGKVYECGDQLDNDDDGRIDADDPGCVGSCDNSETYYTAPIIDGPQDCSADCEFDDNSGHGDDQCYWSHKCDPLQVPPDYYPEPNAAFNCTYDPGASVPDTASGCAELSATQSPQCLAYCGPVTPNGCDCFGCCEFPPKSKAFIYISSRTAGTSQPECMPGSEADPSKCHPCTPVPGCLNSCDDCEVCFGLTALDPSCAAQVCPPGVALCGQPGQAGCPQGTYCITGCCQKTL
jgi:hypothetical protein